MNSIEYRFSQIQAKNPHWSSFSSFAEAIRSRSYSKRSIAHWFKRLVESDDYLKKEKREILRFLGSL